ncbi:MAG: hypothetical protein IPM34_13445 [Saprospiraceae bacterium]|nr:hypothetical protein [Saprospiraceae bacterium]
MSDSFLPEYNERFLEELDLEKHWLESIEGRVNELLETDPGLLFSHLYRLDVEEHILANLIKFCSADSLPKAISEEIWKRQKARAISRRDHPQNLILDSDF